MKRFLTVLVILAAITFYSALRVQPAEAMGTIYIQADGSISPPEAPIQTLDGVKYTLTDNADASIFVQRSSIVIDGAFYNLQGDGTQSGFVLQDVVNITIKNTLISDCFDGIQLFNASDNIITCNTINGSSYEGVGVSYSTGNIITDNNVTNSQIGITFYDSSNNSVFHNSFAGNAYQVYSESSVNDWDNGYPSGGNYWSDYTGSDSFFGAYQNLTGSDGIGETPYSIDVNNVDLYPLKSPYDYWSNPILGDVNRDAKVDMGDIVQILDGFGSVKGSGGYYWHKPPKMFDPHCPNIDIDGNGAVNMGDVATALEHFGQFVHHS